MRERANQAGTERRENVLASVTRVTAGKTGLEGKSESSENGED
jgi:hypothetical protein